MTLPPFETEVPEDAEVAAARSNRALWWRRAWVMVLFVVVAAPLTAFLIWSIRVRFFPPTASEVLAQTDPQLAMAYENYVQKEGVQHRGPMFEQCASALGQRIVPGSPTSTRVITEDELLHYLGPPDLVADQHDGTPAEWVYFYDRFASKDWALFVTLNGASGNRTATQFGWNASNVNSYNGYMPYIASTRPSTTQSQYRGTAEKQILRQRHVATLPRSQLPRRNGRRRFFACPSRVKN